MMRNLAAVELGSRRDCACTVHGRVGRGRQPPPDEGLQSQQPSQRGSKHHFLDDDAASDHGISGGVAAQLRQAGERLAVVIAAGAATATTAAMSAAAMTAAARAAAMGQRHSINTSRIAWEEHEWASALAIKRVTNVDNVGFLHFLLKISGFVG